MKLMLWGLRIKATRHAEPLLLTSLKIEELKCTPPPSTKFDRNIIITSWCLFECEITGAHSKGAFICVCILYYPGGLGITVLTDILHLLVTRMWAGGEPLFLLYSLAFLGVHSPYFSILEKKTDSFSG